MDKKLTIKQQLVLDYIKKYIAIHNYPPAIRDICNGLSLSSPATVHAHIETLKEKGYLKNNASKNRSIELLVANEFEEKDVIQVPLLGKVTAGNPIEAIEKSNEYFPLPSYLVPLNKEVFTLEVSGESMINVGILDQDIVIVERSSVANNGDIIVAMNEENEVTLKTYYKENGYFRLQPENDFMTPIILKNVTILGKAIGLYRKF